MLVVFVRARVCIFLPPGNVTRTIGYRARRRRDDVSVSKFMTDRAPYFAYDKSALPATNFPATSSTRGGCRPTGLFQKRPLLHCTLRRRPDRTDRSASAARVRNFSHSPPLLLHYYLPPLRVLFNHDFHGSHPLLVSEVREQESSGSWMTEDFCKEIRVVFSTAADLIQIKASNSGFRPGGGTTSLPHSAPALLPVLLLLPLPRPSRARRNLRAKKMKRRLICVSGRAWLSGRPAT